MLLSKNQTDLLVTTANLKGTSERKISCTGTKHSHLNYQMECVYGV